MKRTRDAWLAAFLSISTALSLQGQTPPGGPHADSLYQAQKWPEAALAYAKAAQAEPANPRLWYRLGIAEHSQKHFDKSEKAFARAAELPSPPGVPLRGLAFYNLAAARAQLGKSDAALMALDSAIKVGKFPPKGLADDVDFASMKNDSRFKARLESARLSFYPCDTIPQARQFDFWVGDWDVYNSTNKNLAGHSKIDRILSGCAIQENWAGGVGDSGKSFNWFNTVTQEWQQTWIADQAYSTEYKKGKLVGKDLILLADSYTAQNTPIIIKLTFTDLDPNRVRQHFEQSADSGKSWTTTTDLIYVRVGSGVKP